MSLRRRTLFALPWALGFGAARTARASDGTLRKQLRAIHDESDGHAGRLERLSRLFVGKPYVLSPLGEGPDGDRDTDPIADFERFDCVTFAEEVMALAWHRDLDDAIACLQDIRYTAGEIHYAKRKHIMIAQWLPGNVRAKFARDITSEIAGKERRASSRAKLELTHGHFESKRGRPLLLAPDERPIGTFSVPMIHPAAMKSRRNRIPHGTLITTVRAQREGAPYRAAHVGLVTVTDGKRYVCHAHQKSACVIREPIATFLTRSMRPAKWRLDGFHLARVVATAPTG